MTIILVAIFSFSDSNIRGILDKFITTADRLALETHEAPAWFRFIPVPSIKAKYFIPGPFQHPNAETPFKRKVCLA